MNPTHVCILYTHDADLVRRVTAFLRTVAQLRHVEDGDRLQAVLQQTGPTLLLVDLRGDDSRDLIDHVQKDWPQVLITALGTPRSEPLRDLEHAGIYGTEDLQLDRRRFQALVTRALEHLQVLQDNRQLREEALLQPHALTARRQEIAEDRRGPSLPLLRFPRVFRRFDNVDALLNSIAEGVADAAAVTRVGIFARIRESERYKLHAGLRCLPETATIEYSERDPLVRWFELHAHLISRTNLAQNAESADRPLLKRALDTFGAEVIVPLHAGGRITGWLFVGHRVTGQRFEYSDLEGLMILAEHVSTVLENATLHEEVTLQKTLAETLLKSIPSGIVATDEDAIIRWFNPTAEAILGLSAAQVLNKPVEAVDTRLASLLRDTLHSTANLPTQQWLDSTTHRSLAVQTRRLIHNRTPLGAVAVVQDRTSEETLKHRQEVVDRAAFWTDLAASMSHEIRNPLVAIKTFAQLLPERFDDTDFRREYSEVVTQEIERLDKIVLQINSFAHPAELVMKPVDLRVSVKKAIEMTRSRFPQKTVAVETSLAEHLPSVVGDENALAEAFAHLFANATEASAGQKQPRISLSAKPLREGTEPSSVIITVQDNGRGIAPEIQDKIFSPFCTTKARGMGLGLPIVRRTVSDHNGRVRVHSTASGTSVSVTLPASENGSS